MLLYIKNSNYYNFCRNEILCAIFVLIIYSVVNGFLDMSLIFVYEPLLEKKGIARTEFTEALVNAMHSCCSGSLGDLDVFSNKLHMRGIIHYVRVVIRSTRMHCVCHYRNKIYCLQNFTNFKGSFQKYNNFATR